MSIMKVNGVDIQKGLNVVDNLSKLAANMTDPANKTQKKEGKQVYREGDQTNQAHNQTVEVKVGDGSGSAQKPVVLKEKKETHIHKPYPDARNLTTEECEVEKMRIQCENDYKMRELEYRRWQEEELRKERKEKEEYERKQREEREIRRRKSERRGFIAAGVLGAIGLGCLGYSIYTDYRSARGSGLALPAPKSELTIKYTGDNAVAAEGMVE